MLQFRSKYGLKKNLNLAIGFLRYEWFALNRNLVGEAGSRVQADGVAKQDV